MLVALLVFCSLFTNCYSLGQAKTIPLPANLCSRAPLVEPKDILCDVNSTSLVRCWGDRASFNASKDEWSTVCVFRTPPAVSDISKYQCLVKNDLGPVKCKAKNGSTFLASCLFTVFKCKHNCIGKVLSLYDEGGHCGATDRWCPEDNLYSFTAPLASPGTKHIFSDLQQLHLTPPSYCIPWPTWKIATVAVSCVVTLIFIIWSCMRLQRIRKCDKKALAEGPHTKDLENLLKTLPTKKHYQTKDPPETYTSIVIKHDITKTNSDVTTHDVSSLCVKSNDVTSPDDDACFDDAINPHGTPSRQNSGSSDEITSSSPPTSLLRHSNVVVCENSYVNRRSISNLQDSSPCRDAKNSHLKLDQDDSRHFVIADVASKPTLPKGTLLNVHDSLVVA